MEKHGKRSFILTQRPWRFGGNPKGRWGCRSHEPFNTRVLWFRDEANESSRILADCISIRKRIGFIEFFLFWPLIMKAGGWMSGLRKTTWFAQRKEAASNGLPDALKKIGGEPRVVACHGVKVWYLEDELFEADLLRRRPAKSMEVGCMVGQFKKRKS